MKQALLVIDAQKIYTDSESELFCEDCENTIKNINTLIEKFNDNNEPIFYIRHIHNVDGSDLGRMFDFAGDFEDFNFKANSKEVEYDELLIRNPDSKEILKTRYSAFVNTDLEKELRDLGIEKVIICGFMTNFCCESTARHAHDLDFFVDFIADATGCPSLDTMDEEKIKDVVRENLSNGFAVVMDLSECTI